MQYQILLIDDEESQLSLMDNIAKNKLNMQTLKASSGKEAMDILTSEHVNNIDLVILDLMMPDIDGIEILKSIKSKNPNLPFIIRTGKDDVDTAVNVMKLGANDFIQKLEAVKKLENSIIKILDLKKNIISKGNTTSYENIAFKDIIGNSNSIKEIITLSKKVAKSNLPILIEGESGSGKEFLARAIHNFSDRKGKDFIAVNCGAIPENLVESILFGHEKGSFTGAISKNIGKFREADGGTIFLDEVGELKPDMQVKLLRVLQNSEVDPVGSTKPVKVNVNLIYATNVDLSKEVENKKFREDLYYRLNVFPIYLPPLRQRKGDIELLIDYYLDAFAKLENKPKKTIDSDALTLLKKYHWPGNIRQLQNVIYRAVILSENDSLKIEDFPQIINQKRSNSNSLDSLINQINDIDNIINLEIDGDFKPILEIEKEVIIKAIKFYNKNMSKVAQKLAIGRSTLYRKIEDFNIIVDNIMDEKNV